MKNEETRKRKSFGGESRCRVWFIKRRRSEKITTPPGTADTKDNSSDREQPQDPAKKVSSESSSQEAPVLRWDDVLGRLITNYTIKQDQQKNNVVKEDQDSDDATVEELESEDGMILPEADDISQVRSTKPRSRGYGKARPKGRGTFSSLAQGTTFSSGRHNDKHGNASGLGFGSTSSPVPTTSGVSICALGSATFKTRKAKVRGDKPTAAQARATADLAEGQGQEAHLQKSLADQTPLSIARTYFEQLDANHNLQLEDELDREVFGSPLAGGSQHQQTSRTQRTMNRKSPRLVAEYRVYCQAAETCGVAPLALEEFTTHRGQYFKDGLFDGFLDR
jgi:hypothetical protein